MKRNTRQRLLDLVIARLGAEHAARRLKVERQLLDAWVCGSSPLPDEHVVALVDVIDETGDC